MKWLIRQLKNNAGFTLVEVLIAILILSIIATSGTMAFVYAVQLSRSNEYKLMTMNIANDRIEYIRSLKFSEVGTKAVVGGTTIYGDPKGDILQTETKTVSGVKYTINTTIGWEDQSGWDLEDVDWDYKSVKVEVIPALPGKSEDYTKTVETLVTRDSMQPVLVGGNISMRMVRGWSEDATETIPVTNIRVSLTSGPNAPRQIRTSAEGIARFLDLTAGNYNVKLEPSIIGMMLHPGQPSDWGVNVVRGDTKAKEFMVEYPCHLKINLKDLDENPIQLAYGETGSIQLEVPYGTNISKSFTSAALNAGGSLTADYLGDLWPVGTGYAGAYSISDISIPDATYYGAYEENGKTPWTGTFSAPGTTKEVICYLGIIPRTPSGIGTNWAKTNGTITTGTGPFSAGEAKFASSNLNVSLVMQANTASDFNAGSMFFENTGSSTNPGLRIGNDSRLSLNAGVIVFRGSIQIDAATRYTSEGKIVLSTVFTDGNTAPSVPGSEIGEPAEEDRNYGKIYLKKPLIRNGVTILNPGAYYYYDGLELPSGASDLIPITKENYVH